MITKPLPAISSILIGCLAIGATSCTSAPDTPRLDASVTSRRPGQDMDVHAYWYNQGAEIRVFALTQHRYGSSHSGQSVMIYVTEPFDRVLQVKADNPDSPSADPALKLNVTRRFLTGVYPYSTMVSIFQPFIDPDEPGRAWKVTASVQEWCGMVFQQINRRESGLRLRSFSYFMSEGDQDRLLPGAWMEDELWTRLRINPASLPVGQLSLVPGALYCRLAHRDPAPQAAEATLEPLDAPGPAGQALRRYTVTYAEIDRTLAIDFAATFPYEINAWQESWGGGTTRAVCTHHRFLPYWRLNSPDNRDLRRELGLPTDR